MAIMKTCSKSTTSSALSASRGVFVEVGEGVTSWAGEVHRERLKPSRTRRVARLRPLTFSGMLDFQDLIDHAGGLMAAEVYKRIYLLGANHGGLFVEVGTAHGAATVALAAGAAEGGQPFRMVTVDPFGGPLSSRAAHGSPTDNMRIVESNLARFGVAEHVEIVRGTVDDLVRRDDINDVSVLVIDADGRIDRDLYALYDRLAPGCTIVLDDVDGPIYLAEIGGRRILAQKHRLGALLARAFIDAGVLRDEERLHATGFYRLGDAPREAVLAAALPAYRELVFAEVPEAGLSGARRHVRSMVARIPLARRAYRRVRGC
jgi:predicted O-methyltransferase YrrM